MSNFWNRYSGNPFSFLLHSRSSCSFTIERVFPLVKSLFSSLVIFKKSMLIFLLSWWDLSSLSSLPPAVLLRFVILLAKRNSSQHPARERENHFGPSVFTLWHSRRASRGECCRSRTLNKKSFYEINKKNMLLDSRIPFCIGASGVRGDWHETNFESCHSSQLLCLCWLPLTLSHSSSNMAAMRGPTPGIWLSRSIQMTELSIRKRERESSVDLTARFIIGSV